jgi:nucleoside-diphosphate-sugar epimerase
VAHPGVLAMTLVVRDEEDILDTNLRYHLAQGVDFVYAIDHNSTDGTPDILRGYEQMGVLRMFREDGDINDQAPRVTPLARLAHDELGADWVINVGSYVEISIENLARLIIEQTGSPSEVVLIPYAEGYEAGFEDMTRRVPDTSKIADLIGWRPTRRLEQIIDDVAAFQGEAPARAISVGSSPAGR